MPPITAILHTHDDRLRVARAIESLRSCDEVLVIDHGSGDDTCDIARRFGARVIAAAGNQASTEPYLREATHDWIFCLQPTESLAESLEASLLEWKLAVHSSDDVYELAIQEEADVGWDSSVRETRLVHRDHKRWIGWKPVPPEHPVALEGCLTRFRTP